MDREQEILEALREICRQVALERMLAVLDG